MPERVRRPVRLVFRLRNGFSVGVALVDKPVRPLRLRFQLLGNLRKQFCEILFTQMLLDGELNEYQDEFIYF